MNKKNILVLCLLLLLIPVSFAHADETEYQSQGDVGFTGTWEIPKSEELPNTEEPLPITGDVPAKNIILPQTGDSATASLVTSSFGILILFLMTFYKKFKGEGAMKQN
ncbi:LPXTG cell wall anchor domain-containing protein [Lactococcus laudensis]|uniref:LPXTG cell wall anchor domain-containing protein n=1 Tax=Pseudolactococcus laudensis TaxID=1494461 RepID=A0A7V8MZT3_9LACT|nr:LPXTG cell wall anchor domain-containing protein [Lactococcus laudensis]MBA0015932.1 LPXTG cell wall anchor domain-containing protein [Lactococcus laudensis]MBW9281119.1 LPXTG cell wall anchor domain-containing protein [Lactococcus laudensis]